MADLIEKQESKRLLRAVIGIATLIFIVTILFKMNPTNANEVPPIVSRDSSTQVIEKKIIDKEKVILDSHDEKQIRCLAENAYFEAGNQSKKGMIAVTNVVMNRVEDKRFPKTACAVVKQKRRGVCQFSWVCESNKRIRDVNLFRKTREVAEDVYLKNVGDVTHGAKFYHANYVRPSWSRVFDRTTTIGAHIFYRG